MKKTLILIASAILALSSCTKDAVTSEFSLDSASSVNIPFEGLTTVVTFTTNTDWCTSLSDKEWAAVFPTSGSAGTHSVKVSFLKNKTEDSRELTLTFTAGDKTAQVLFNQLPEGQLALSTDNLYNVTYRDTVINAKVLSNVEYTVTCDANWITLTPPTKGVTEKTTVISVSENTASEPREAVVTFISEDQELSSSIIIKQEGFVPYFTFVGVDDSDALYVAKEGGDQTFSVSTNVEYTYSNEFSWITVKDNKDGSYTLTASATDKLDTREGYVKFTVPALDKDYYVYLYQDGKAEIKWRTDFFSELACENSSYTSVIAGDYLIVSNANGLFVFNKGTGEFVSKLNLGLNPKGITNDDAGNIVYFTGGEYDLEGLGNQTPLSVDYITPAELISGTPTPKHLISYNNGFYGYGLDNIRVTGDVSDQAVITMISAAGWDGGTFIVYWDTKKTTTEYTGYNNMTWSSEIWSSRSVVAKAAGASTPTGFFSAGYDGNYNLHYTPDNNDNWAQVFETGSSWAEGYNAMDIKKYGDKTYLSLLGMTYFGKTNWGDDSAPYSYLPSYLFLLDITTPSAPVQVCETDVTMTEDLYIFGSTTDVNLQIEGKNLVAYVIDSGISAIYKMVYPME